MKTPSISRRSLLTAAAAGGAATLIGQGPSLIGGALASAESESSQIVSWAGPHQAGITTPGQRHLQICAFDVTATNRAQLIDLLTKWQRAIEVLTVGQQLPGSTAPTVAPSDTGEAAGQTASHLTITIGFGATLFDGRFGLASQRPAALIDLPAFKGDQLNTAISGGDLSVQACADSRFVAEHAVRMLARVGKGLAELRWLQSGFDEPPARADQGSGRNLFGTKDGTSNLDRSDDARMRRNVWVSSEDGPAWMANGTYQVYRRVNMTIETWDDSPLEEQEDVIGRRKASGAPFGGTREFDPVDVSKLPIHSHVRLSNPRTGTASEDERILRRGYSFHDGINPTTGEYDAGLAFIAYQRDPRRQFVTIQTRLAENDTLNEYLFHTASGIFAIPPGAPSGQFVGAGLFATPGSPPPADAPLAGGDDAPPAGPPAGGGGTPPPAGGGGTPPPAGGGTPPPAGGAGGAGRAVRPPARAAGRPKHPHRHRRPKPKRD